MATSDTHHTVAARYCTNCGRELGSANFCSSCGERVAKELDTEQLGPFDGRDAAAQHARESVDAGAVPPVAGLDAAERLAEEAHPLYSNGAEHPTQVGLPPLGPPPSALT